MKVVFLVSGNGGTLKFIHRASAFLNLDICIVGVISDRECGAIDFARKSSISSNVIKPWKERINDVVDILQRLSPDIVVTNIFKILPSEVFTCLNNADFINLHYSLLPSYGGVIGFRTLEMARDNNAKIIGATCHYVNEKVDEGIIIIQGAISVDWMDDFHEIGNNVFRVACKSILSAMLILDGNKSEFESSDGFLYSPKLKFDDSMLDESFWDELRNL